jgi:hypothetical protein
MTLPAISECSLGSAKLLLTTVDGLTACQRVNCVKLIFDQTQLPAPLSVAPHCFSLLGRTHSTVGHPRRTIDDGFEYRLQLRLRR